MTHDEIRKDLRRLKRLEKSILATKSDLPKNRLPSVASARRLLHDAWVSAHMATRYMKDQQREWLKAHPPRK